MKKNQYEYYYTKTIIKALGITPFPDTCARCGCRLKNDQVEYIPDELDFPLFVCRPCIKKAAKELKLKGIWYD